MKRKHSTAFSGFAMLFVLLLAFDSGTVRAASLYYSVTIENLTAGQPFSPPVAATHKGGPLRMFTVGRLASAELEAIAEDGNQAPMVGLFSAGAKVTETVDVGAPLAPGAATTFGIMAKPGDRLSLATMLICTDDGFTGLNRARLPKQGAEIRWAAGYDAGTEDNTELSADIVDACSALGPIVLPGDDNGNENAAVDTDPAERIAHHPNILGGGNLTIADHAWADPVAKITITRVDADATKFLARLQGAGEVPPVMATSAFGQAKFRLNGDETELGFRLKALRIESGVAQAHIHVGLPSENGAVVAFLFGLSAAGDERVVISGRLSVADLAGGPFVGDFAGFVAALRAGELYVNVHSTANPTGEIRGQIGAR